MAYTKKNQYEKQILEAIKKHKIAFFDHVFAFVPFCAATGYKHKLEKVEAIRDALSENRIKAKNYMLNKWIAGENATLQIAAYRLLSNQEEHKRLNQSYIDHTTKGDKIEQVTIHLPEEEKDDE
jgi:hypothetical protein